MENRSGSREELARAITAEFAWLEELGFVRTQRDPRDPSFRYDAPAARVGVFVDIGRSDIEVSVAPPEGEFWDNRIMLRSLLTAHGHPEQLPSRIGARESWEVVLAAYSRALRLLEQTELAGDWGIARQARQVTAARRRASFDSAIAATTHPEVLKALQSVRDDPRGKARHGMLFDRDSPLVRQALDVAVEDWTPASWLTMIVRDTLRMDVDDAKGLAPQLLEYLVIEDLVELRVEDAADRSKDPERVDLVGAKPVIDDPSTWEPDSRKLSDDDLSHGSILTFGVTAEGKRSYYGK